MIHEQPGRRAWLRMAGAAFAGGVAFAAGCRAANDVPDPPRALATLADRYTDLVLRLARQQPSLVEQWLGPAARATVPRVPAAELQGDAVALLTDTTTFLASDGWRRHRDALAVSAGDGISDVHRAAYLAGQIRALEAAAGRLLGDSQGFGAEAVRMLGRAVPVREAAPLDTMRHELAQLLPPGPGSLAERHAAFRRGAAVPPERVEAVFTAAVEWCRRAAATHLPLPEGETLITRGEDATGWAAFSRPSGPRSSELWVARRGGADAAHLLQLAAHEGTPGHHAQHVLASTRLVEGRGWHERLLHPGFGPHRLYAEGAAEAGADLLLPEAVRIAVCAEALLPAAGLPSSLAPQLVRVERRAAALDLEVAHIAAAYLDTSLSSEVATTRLRDEALVLDPPGLLGFIEKQRVYALAYPLGRRLVTEAIGSDATGTGWPALGRIATTLTLAHAGEE